MRDFFVLPLLAARAQAALVCLLLPALIALFRSPSSRSPARCTPQRAPTPEPA